MTERTFKTGVNKLSDVISKDDRQDFVNDNERIIDAIIYIRSRAESGKEIDDWECWLGNILFKGI